MIASELKALLCQKYGLEEPWPKHLEVDPETYANVCQSIFDNQASDDDYNVIKRITLSFGINNGIMFKGTELILDGKKPSNHLSLEEIKIIYNLLSHQYISYEDEKSIAVVRKMRQLIERS